jgi:hypothetical protein
VINMNWTPDAIKAEVNYRQQRLRKLAAPRQYGDRQAPARGQAQGYAQPATGNPTRGQAQANAQPATGNATRGQTTRGQTTDGQPATGQAVARGQAQTHGQSAQGQPTRGQSAHGRQAHGHPAHGSEPKPRWWRLLRTLAHPGRGSRR